MTFKPTDYLPYDFANRRHIGPSPAEMEEMLKVVGAKDLDALIDDTIPANIRQKEPLDFGKAKSERELLHHMRVTASKNKVLTSLIGQGYHGTVTPPAIQRNILENPAWYTAYTPYQPEISQGRLEALLNFQTMVSRPDRASRSPMPRCLTRRRRAAEAMTMAQRVSESRRFNQLLRGRKLPPAEHRGDEARAPQPLGIEVIVGSPRRGGGQTRSLARSSSIPARYGHLRDFYGARSRQAARTQGHRHRDLSRSAGADPAQGAGRDGRRYRRGLHAALWRAGRAMAVRTPPTWPAKRRNYKRNDAGAHCWGFVSTATATAPTACQPADPRAAYPPRKGHVERLHRAGAAWR